MEPQHQVTELDRAECLQLLSTVPFGRIVHTRNALPAVRLVNHVVLDGQLVMAAELGLPEHLTSAGTVIAYQADSMDVASRAGWSVMVIGRAFRASEMLAGKYRALRLPWLDADADEVITVGTDLAQGFRLLPTRARKSAGASSAT